MKLTVDTIAPDFETEDIFGQPISLRAYAGKPLLLSFFRNGACAMCNLRVHHLIERFGTCHAQGLEVVAVFESPRESILTNVSKQNAPFPIIADPTAALYELYGVETSQEKVMAPVDEEWRNAMIREAESIGYRLTPEEGANFFRLPADFLIGPHQRIESAFYSNAVGEHLAFDDIERTLRQLTQNQEV